MKSSMKKLHKKVASHLKEDMKGYSKQRKHLKKEIKEDRALLRKVKRK